MRINDYFKNKYPFLTSYFESFFNSKKRFPQSIVFEGLDILSQYFFTLELARILNCEKDKMQNCDCTNCRWIKENKHPSIINVTPIDFKDDSSKTVISVKQTEKITSMIKESSDYHRFFIFSNAKTGTLDDFKLNKIKEFENLGYNLSKEEWYPYPLNKKILQEEASNSLLKSTEEAPDKVTFVFLSNTKEDIISTIVSRSLVFKMPALYEKNSIDVKNFFENYPNENILSSIEKAYELINFQSANNFDMLDILDSMQEYLFKMMKINFDNENLRNIINFDIKKIQKTKKQIIALVSPKYALESLFTDFSTEGRNLF